MTLFLPSAPGVLLWALLLLTATPSPAQPASGKTAFGRIHYPASDLINLQQGSFEVIVTLNFDPAQKHLKPYTSPMAFFLLRDFPQENEPRLLIHFRSITTYQQQRGEGELLTSVLGQGDARAALALGGELIHKSLRVPAREHQLHKGQTVHLAFTWKYHHGAYTSAMFINGARSKEQTGRGIPQLTFHDRPEIWIGAPQFHSAYGTIHGMRFSSVARGIEDFQQSAKSLSFEHDGDTLYIEDFQTVDPQLTGPQPLGKGGSLDGAYRIIETSDQRRAVQLNHHDEEAY